MNNVILIGMMGCGKTTVGKLLAEKLGRELADTDVLIEEREGRTIPEIFAAEGEAYFRELELAVCKKLNKSQSPSTAIWITTVAACLLSCLPKYTELLVNLGSLVAAVNIAMVILAAVFARKKTTLEEGAFAAPGGNAVSILTVVIILCTYIPKFTSGDLQMWLFTAIIYGLGLLAMVYYRLRAK